ncbi:hypothetical protein D0Z08_27640 [Nocardioides immobilis]|uniref:Uncharacterized protein n=2 Tax=Nocardioides immobilis TaxID=2049295 RepID=A0A417XUI6_9ACTN|nr:hypothetical protein D0Z08_27640 [Nocardioides immobilis]
MVTMHRQDDLLHDMREELHDLTHFSEITADRKGRLTLWLTFIALPLVWGVDMIFDLMGVAWEAHVATWANDAFPGTASDLILWVGVVMVALAACVAVAPHIGGDLLGLAIALLAVNLMWVDGAAHLVFGMIALALCCFAMARMAHGDREREVAPPLA